MWSHGNPWPTTASRQLVTPISRHHAGAAPHLRSRSSVLAGGSCILIFTEPGLRGDMATPSLGPGRCSLASPSHWAMTLQTEHSDQLLPRGAELLAKLAQPPRADALPGRAGAERRGAEVLLSQRRTARPLLFALANCAAPEATSALRGWRPAKTLRLRAHPEPSGVTGDCLSLEDQENLAALFLCIHDCVDTGFRKYDNIVVLCNVTYCLCITQKCERRQWPK